MPEPLISYRVYITQADLDYLDAMGHEGGFRNNSALIRSLLRAIIADDKAAHEEKAA